MNLRTDRYRVIESETGEIAAWFEEEQWCWDWIDYILEPDLLRCDGKDADERKAKLYSTFKVYDDDEEVFIERPPRQKL